MTAETARRDVLVPARTRTLGQRISRLFSRTAVHAALIIIALLWLIPTVGLAITSVRPRGDILGSGWWTVFTNPDFTLENYQQVFDAPGVAQGIMNSFLITVPATILPIIIAALAAYAFAWLKFPFRDAIFLFIVALMVVPIQIAFVPALQILSAIRIPVVAETSLTGSYLGIWLAHTAFGLPFAIFLLRNFFVQLPGDLIEAAQMDGASTFNIFRRIVLPLSVPALASLAVFQFLWVWNDLLMALIFVQQPSQLPLTVVMSQLVSGYGQEFNILSSASFILMLVPLCVFFALQRYFVRGITAGAVK